MVFVSHGGQIRIAITNIVAMISILDEAGLRQRIDEVITLGNMFQYTARWFHYTGVCSPRLYTKLGE